MSIHTDLCRLKLGEMSESKDTKVLRCLFYINVDLWWRFTLQTVTVGNYAFEPT